MYRISHRNLCRPLRQAWWHSTKKTQSKTHEEYSKNRVLNVLVTNAIKSGRFADAYCEFQMIKTIHKYSPQIPCIFRFSYQCTRNCIPRKIHIQFWHEENKNMVASGNQYIYLYARYIFIYMGLYICRSLFLFFLEQELHILSGLTSIFGNDVSYVWKQFIYYYNTTKWNQNKSKKVNNNIIRFDYAFKCSRFVFPVFIHGWILDGPTFLLVSIPKYCSVLSGSSDVWLCLFNPNC